MALHVPLTVAPNAANPFGKESALNLNGTKFSDARGALYTYFGTAPHAGYVGGHPHQGTDYSAPVGTPVYAIAPSYVLGRFGSPTFARGYYILTRYHTKAGGWVVVCEQHLSSFVAAAGTTVAAGALVGRVGTSGQVTGPHCHVEIRFTTLGTAAWTTWQTWRAVNPLRIMPGGDLAANSAFIPA